MGLGLAILLLVSGLWGIDLVDTAGLADNSTIWTAHEHHLIIADNTVNWTGGADPSMQRVDMGDHHVYGLAYDYRTSLVVMSDPRLNTLMTWDIGSGGSFFLHVGTSSGVGQLTADWLGRNLYWTDTVYGWIALKHLPTDMTRHNSLDIEFKVIVDKYLDSPTGIVVHPHKRYLFWADAGRYPKIERSDLAGNQRRVITWYGMITPTALCIDQSTDSLYWSDQSRGTIESADFQGNNRRIIVSDDSMGYYGITVFDGTILTTAPNRNLSLVYSLTSGNLVRSILTNIPLYYIDVYSGEEQPRSENEACDSAACDHVCFPADVESGFTCQCNDGYRLQLDEKTCAADTGVLQRHLMYTNGSSICAVSINMLNSYKYVTQNIDCSVVTLDKDIIRFAMDMMDNSIFFTDGNIIYKQLAYSSVQQTFYSSTSEISDIDYNWKTKNIVWAEPDEGRIMTVVGSSIGESPTVLVGQLDHPTAIAVDPHNNRVYWVSRDGLGVLHGDGTTEDIATETMSHPTDLEYDRLGDRLVWNDNDGYVAMVNTDGTGETKLSLTPNVQREAVTVFKKYIILTTTGNEDVLFDVVQEDDRTITTISIVDVPSINIMDAHVFDTTLQPSDLEACEVDNGGCGHICLPQGDDGTCACRLGYDLAVDGKACTSTLVTSDFIIVVDTMSKRLYQVDAQTAELQAFEIEPGNVPVAIAYDTTRRHVLWVDQHSRSVKVKELTGRTELAVGTDVSEGSHIAVDATDGAVYVTMATHIRVFTPSGHVVTLLSGTDVMGTPTQIEVIPEAGIMVWIETGPAAPRIAKANMDGSVVKGVVTGADRIQAPADIAVDFADTDEGYSVYWCDSDLDKIDRVNLDTLTTDNIYSVQNTRPLALDVSGDYVYFIGGGNRHISRINKRGGGGYTLVLESPFVGSLAAIYVWKPAPTGHGYCGNCNGGCSTVCLPRNSGRTCACSDGSTLGSDDRTCNNVNRCATPDGATGFRAWAGCCLETANAICGYTCKAGLAASPYPLLCLPTGRWNVSADDICKPEPSTTGDGAPTAVYAGAGAGAGVLLLVGVAVSVVCWRRHVKRFADTQRRPSSLSLPSRAEVDMVASRRASESGSAAPPEVTARAPSTNNKGRPLPDPDDSEYAYIDDTALAKEKAAVEKRLSTDSTHSRRYSRWPKKEDGSRSSAPYTVYNPSPYKEEYRRSYVEFTNEGYADDGSDGYLTASFSGSVNSVPASVSIRTGPDRAPTRSRSYDGEDPYSHRIEPFPTRPRWSGEHTHQHRNKY